MVTPKHNLPELVGSTLSFETLNTVLRHYEQLPVLAVEGFALSKPLTIQDGQAYIVALNAVSGFAGRDYDIAFSVGGAMYFITPKRGTQAFRNDTKNHIIFDGVRWVNSPFASVEAQTRGGSGDLGYVNMLALTCSITTNPIYSLLPYAFNATMTIKNVGTNSFRIAADVQLTITPGTTRVWYNLANNPGWVLR